MSDVKDELGAILAVFMGLAARFQLLGITSLNGQTPASRFFLAELMCWFLNINNKVNLNRIRWDGYSIKPALLRPNSAPTGVYVVYFNDNTLN